MTICGGTTRGTDIKVCGKLSVHPSNNRLAETTYHDGDGCGERGDQHGSAIQRGCQASRGEESFHAKKFSEELSGEGGQEANQRRNGIRGGDDQQDGGQVTEQRSASDGRHLGGKRCCGRKN